jgi:transposase
VGAASPRASPAARRYRPARQLEAHKAPAVHQLIAARGATVKFLPPYSHDFNPIESVWAWVKKDIKTFAPRIAGALRRVARAARHAVTAEHCRRFVTHIGYINPTA